MLFVASDNIMFRTVNKLKVIHLNDSSHILRSFILLCIICTILVNCTKEVEPAIRVTNLKAITGIFERDTLKIEYNVSGKGLDSVCLFIGDSIRITDKTSQHYFLYVHPKPGGTSFQLKLGAYYKSGEIMFSDKYIINISTLYTPEMIFNIKRYDGLSSYFVGEKLSITVKPRNTEEDMSAYTSMTFYLNGDNLGTVSSPYTFLSNEIKTAENNVKIELKDKNNRIHIIQTELMIPVNVPPVVNLSFSYRNRVPGRAYFTSDKIYLELSVSDDIMIDHLEYYLDDEKISSTSYNLSSISLSPFIVGTLPAGAHNIYFVAYDDRGASKKSGILSFLVFTSFKISSKIVDTEFSNAENVVFVATNSKIYLLNPVNDELIKTVDLPFSDATSIDFINEDNSLYIATAQGKLFRWNISDQVFEEIIVPGISNIKDIEIDSEHHAMIISNNDLFSLNLSDGIMTKGIGIQDNGSSLIFDRSDNLVLSGGNPHLSASYVYVHQYYNDTLRYIRKANIGAFAKKMYLRSGKNEFLISCQGSINNVRAYNTTSLVKSHEYNVSVPVSAAYSPDGNFVYTGDDDLIRISVFDAESSVLLRSFTLPLDNVQYIDQILPNINNSRLVIATWDDLNLNAEVIFIHLK